MTENSTREERFAHGLEVLRTINGEAGQRVIDSLSDISPELAHQIVAWGFGEIYSRPQLVPRDRQLVTLGMLTALGGCEPQLEVHINAALNMGLTPEQILEALLHAAGYCGFPKALNATFVAKKVFAERGGGAGGGAPPPAPATGGCPRRGERWA
ncbi:carboxymuconolactone decarboxylase family protein, partial [Streptomyces sp. NPDC059627]